MVSQAGAPDGVSSAASAPGRWVAAITVGLPARQVLGEEPTELGGVDVGVGVTPGGSGERAQHQVVGHLGVAAAQGVGRRHALALGEGVRRDVDQRA